MISGEFFDRNMLPIYIGSQLYIAKPSKNYWVVNVVEINDGYIIVEFDNGKRKKLSQEKIFEQGIVKKVTEEEEPWLFL